MVPAFNVQSCPNLAVPAEVMEHVATVESGGNRFAIGVVSGRLERQPRNLAEAVATARMLESHGYNYSLGISQINRSNLFHSGLDTYEKAFDGCANLVAGASILADCYQRSHHDWGKAFSCYYSGNEVDGYRDGYVDRVYRSLGVAWKPSAQPITVYPQTREHPQDRPLAMHPSPTHGSGVRAALRSLAIDATVGTSAEVVQSLGTKAAGSLAADDGLPLGATVPPGTPMDGPFVPRVSAPGEQPSPAMAATPGSPNAVPPSLTNDPVHGPAGPDPAFVF